VGKSGFLGSMMGKKTEEIIMIKVPIDIKIQNLLKLTISHHLIFFLFLIPFSLSFKSIQDYSILFLN